MTNRLTREEAREIAGDVEYPTNALNRLGLAHAIADALMDAVADDVVIEVPNEPDVPEKRFGEKVHEALAKAEEELLAWASGERSYTNEQMSVETYYTDTASGQAQPDRGLTLVRIAERDAAEIELATNRLVALRLLAGLTKEGALINVWN